MLGKELASPRRHGSTPDAAVTGESGRSLLCDAPKAALTQKAAQDHSLQLRIGLCNSQFSVFVGGSAAFLALGSGTWLSMRWGN